MADPEDAILPILKKIQRELSDFRLSSEAKINDIAENLLDMKEDISTIQRDMLMHLGLTTRHRADFEDLREEVAEIKSRIAALEARS